MIPYGHDIGCADCTISQGLFPSSLNEKCGIAVEVEFTGTFSAMDTFCLCVFRIYIRHEETPIVIPKRPRRMYLPASLACMVSLLMVIGSSKV